MSVLENTEKGLYVKYFHILSYVIFPAKNATFLSKKVQFEMSSL